MRILLVRGQTLWNKRSFGVKHCILFVSLYYVLILEHYFSLHFDSISMISHHWCPIIDPLLTVQRVIHHVDQNIIGPNYKGQVSIKILTWKKCLFCLPVDRPNLRLCSRFIEHQWYKALDGPDLTAAVSATSNSSNI